jgi:hypothetical protein
LLGDLGVEKFVGYIIYKKEGRLGSGNVVWRIKEGRLFFLKSGDCGFWGLRRRRGEEVLEILGKNISRLFLGQCLNRPVGRLLIKTYILRSFYHPHHYILCFYWYQKKYLGNMYFTVFFGPFQEGYLAFLKFL